MAETIQFITVSILMLQCSAFMKISPLKSSTKLHFKNEEHLIPSVLENQFDYKTKGEELSTIIKKSKQRNSKPSFLSDLMTTLKQNSRQTWDDLTQKRKDDVKSWFIKRGENRGVPFTESYSYFDSKLAVIKKNYKEIMNDNIEYPDYYLETFHGYETGNMGWDAARDGLPATISIPLSFWPKENPVETTEWYRGNYTQSLSDYYKQSSGCSSPKKILDIGGSVGASTQSLLKAFPKSNVSLLDLSPFFLGTAKTFLEDKDSPLYVKDAKDRVTYHHELAEATSFQDGTFDVISISFVTHELPTDAIEKLINECSRLLKKGGVFSCLDLDSNVVMNLPPLRRSLFSISEPHIDDYCHKTNTLKSLQNNNDFERSIKLRNDPMNSHWMAQKM
jgi:ubiquinone/menaquinone biosynthesis C-methylase UbiE